jgi:uncharacterized membrane protein YccC
LRAVRTISTSPVARARDWLDAADPGTVRRAHGIRTVLAALSTLLSLEVVFALAGKPQVAGLILYAVFASFIAALVVADPRPRDRAITLAWSVPAFAVATALAALAEAVRFLPSVLLLVLIFVAFAARRAGVRAGELAVLLAMGTYFAGGFHPSLADVPWLTITAAVGVAWLALWQLVLVPYDPVRSIRAAARAYGVRIADVVAGISEALRERDTGGTDVRPDRAPADKAGALARQLRLVQLTRRVIEAQFPGARAPGGWTSEELTRFQVALYEAELGAAQMVDSCADGDVLRAMPAPIRDALASTLTAIAEALRDMRDPRLLAALAERADNLRDRVMEARQQKRGDGVDPLDAPPPWVVAGLRITNGGRRIARSVATVRALQAATGERTRSGVGDALPQAAARVEPQAGGKAGPRPGAQVRLGGLSLHVTSALGLQAVIATGLSMAIAWLAGVEHPNWVFWTSFVVIAGSLDESVRRVMYRVGGTTIGVVLGVILATLLPDELAWVVAGMSAAVFLAIYWAPVSHGTFVMWLNVAFALGYAQRAGGTLELLVERPVMTAIGAAVSVVVVVRVLPIRRSGQYAAAVVAFLAAIREAIGAWMTKGAAGSEVAPLPAIDAALRRVQETSRARDGGAPFSAAGRAADEEETEVAALAIAVTRLATAVEMEPDAARRDLPVAIAERISENLGAAMALAGGTDATLVPTVEDLVQASPQPPGPPTPSTGSVSETPGIAPPSGGSILAGLVDVHACVVRLGATLARRHARRSTPGARS